MAPSTAMRPLYLSRSLAHPLIIVHVRCLFEERKAQPLEDFARVGLESLTTFCLLRARMIGKSASNGEISMCIHVVLLFSRTVP